MLQAASMREMPERVVRRKETKQDRKAEQQKIGRLSDQRVSPNTFERYVLCGTP